MSSIKSVNEAIMFGDFTNAQLESIVDAVKYRRSQIAKENKRAFGLGDSVKFTSARNGQTYTGTVEKIKIKYILVKTNIGRFNVPANMLVAA